MRRSNRLPKTIYRHIKLALIPHRANQYRPRLVRRRSLLGVLTVIVAVQVGYSFLATETVLGAEAAMTADALLDRTNKERIDQQLRPLRADKSLAQAAYLKAQNMFDKQYWAHTAPDGTAPWQWFGNVGYDYAYAGENLAKNFRTSNTVVAAWMTSPEHRANILDPHYLDAGFAVVDGVLNGKNATIVVALYGAPAGQGVAGDRANNAPAARPLGALAQLGVAIQTMPPAALGSVFLMLMVTGVAFFAHMYRARLPKKYQNSWYRHHGLVKAGGSALFVVVIIVLYSGGQI